MVLLYKTIILKIIWKKGPKMQLEESDGSKDVPPLSCRGFFWISTFVENRVAGQNHNGLTVSTSFCSKFGFSFRDSLELPD